MAIEKNFHKFLFELVLSELRHNQVAKTIAVNYQRLNRTNKEKFFESLLPLYNIFSDSNLETVKFRQSSPIEGTTISKDFRLKAVRLANVRGIPRAKEGIKYGFDLFENNNIQNLVLLGPNGTGKSSIFSGIEYIYSNRVGELDLRTTNPESNNSKDFIDYLTHFTNTPECEIETNSGRFSIRNSIFNSDEDRKTVYPENHFICDNDIYKKGQLNYLGDNIDETSFHYLIANSLGLQDYLDFSNLLRSLSKYRRVKDASKRRDLIEEKENLDNEIIKHQRVIEAKKIAISELKSNNQPLAQENKSDLFSIIGSLSQTTYKILFSKSDFQKSLTDFNSTFEIFIGLSVNPDLQTEAQFLSLGLELINHSEDCPFCNSSNKSIGEIKNLVEKRIVQIKEFETSSKNLAEAVERVSLEIKVAFKLIQFIFNSVSAEREKISGISELSALYAKESEIIEFLGNTINNVITEEKNISEILEQSSLLGKAQALSDYLKKNETVFYIELPNIPGVIEKFAIDRLRIIKNTEERMLQNSKDLTVSQQIISLESDLKNSLITIDSIQKQISSVKREIEKVDFSIDTFSKIKEETSEFVKILDLKVNSLVTSTFGSIKDTITEILTDYIAQDTDEKVSLLIELEEKPHKDDPDLLTKTVVAKILTNDKSSGEQITISPNKYFNTFRFRLFCMMVSLSIVIAARRNSGINLPLFLDDVFYASDYNSKSTFRNFILKILNIFRKYNGEMPLQLLLFTHDELVFDCALGAIMDFESDENDTDPLNLNREWLKPLSAKTVFSRLFLSSDVDEMPSESPFGRFWDLTYRIPRQIQTQLLNETV